jgi:hypothetical protein
VQPIGWLQVGKAANEGFPKLLTMWLLDEGQDLVDRLAPLPLG